MVGDILIEEMDQQNSKKINLGKELGAISHQLIKNYRPQKIILFGSFANGSPRPSSDLDLAIIKETDKRFIDRLRDVSEIIQSPLGVDVLVYTPQEWNDLQDKGDYFVKEIINTGKVVYERQ